MATHSTAFTWSIIFSFLFLFLTFSFTSLFPPFMSPVAPYFPIPIPDPSCHASTAPCFTSHSLIVPVALLHLFGLLPPTAQVITRQGRPLQDASYKHSSAAYLWISDIINCSRDVTGMSAMAAAVGDGSTHLLSLSKVTRVTAPPVPSKQTLIYISTH